MTKARGSGRTRAGKPREGGPGRALPFIRAALVFVGIFVAASLAGSGGPKAGLWAAAPCPPMGDHLTGEVGCFVGDGLLKLFGIGSLAIPFLLLVAAASLGRWWNAPLRRKAWILLVTFLGFAPACAYLVQGGKHGAAGALGSALGGPLLAGLGLGAWLVVAGIVVIVSVLVFSVNPMMALGTGLRTAAARARKLWLRSAGKRRSMRLAAKAPASLASDSGRRGRPSPPSGAPKKKKRRAAGAKDQAASGRAAPEERSEAIAPPEPKSEGRAPQREAAEAPPEEDLILTDPASPAGAAVGRPGLDLLAEPRREGREEMEEELDRLGEKLIDTLKTYGVKCELKGRTTGPVVTQFAIVPAPGVKVNRIVNLERELALATKSESIRIVAPIPGRGAVGIELPNPKREIVHLSEVLASKAFRKSAMKLPLVLGKDIEGRMVVADLARMPHTLIAGATGSGKSVCLNAMITSLIYRHTPETLRLLLIDPKMVELSVYSDLPHLRHPVVTDHEDAGAVLKWAVMEMERRYALLTVNGVRGIEDFNRRIDAGDSLKAREPREPDEPRELWAYEDGPLPYVVLVLDELADLMMRAQADVERPLAQLAQKARAIGIHLLVATQRPSVNVITGLIKANFPCRIAFRVAQKVDSRTILDQNGADALLGYGDMLYMDPGPNPPLRVQGAYISTRETEALMDWYRSRAEEGELQEAGAGMEEDILEAVRDASEEAETAPAKTADRDALFEDAAQVCVQQGSGSTSLLQRRLRIGYGRAARIIDQLHESGVLGPPDGSKPRELLSDAAGIAALSQADAGDPSKANDQSPAASPEAP